MGTLVKPPCVVMQQILNRSPCARSHHVVAQLGQRPRQSGLANLQFLLEFFLPLLGRWLSAGECGRCEVARRE